jgi:hypothetical protein
MPPSATLQSQAIGRSSHSRTPTARREPVRTTGGGVSTAWITRALCVVGLGVAVWQGQAYLTAGAPPPTQTTISADAITGIQLTLGQAALALRDFGTGGTISDRFSFEANMSRIRQSVANLEGSASEAEQQQALSRAKSLLERLLLIERNHIARVEAGGGAMDSRIIAEITSLRDEAALALFDFRQAGIRRATVAESNTETRILQGTVAAAIGLLSTCIGAISLWSRFSSA